MKDSDHYKEVVSFARMMDEGVPLMHVTAPTIEGDNMTVSLNKEAYIKNMEANKYNIIGWLMLQNGEPMNNCDLK